MADSRLITNPIYIHIASPEETEELGILIGSMCRTGDIICLGGDLGAGKTTLAQAIAQGAGVAAGTYVTSPTFAIMHEYTGKFPIYHMDFYRLRSADDVIELGLDEYFHANGLSLIEWFDRAGDIIPASRLAIQLSFINEASRQVILDGSLPRWKNLPKLVGRRFLA